ALQLVELLSGQATEKLDASVAKRNPDGSYELIHECDVSLAPGANPIQFAAINEGGREAQGVTITYTPRPVEVVIERLMGESEAATYVPLRARAGLLVVDRVADGRLQLTGRVIRRDAPSQAGPLPRVLVRVNGFLQAPRVQTKRAESGTVE